MTNVVFLAPTPSDPWTILRDIVGTAPFWVAVAVAIIAYRQWRTARDKFRLDLYEKRFKVYRTVLNFFSSVISRDAEAALREFDDVRREAFFLFGQDKVILKYLDTVRNNAEAYSSLKARVHETGEPPNAERSELAEKMRGIGSWFFKQFDEINPIFAPYLSFKK